MQPIAALVFCAAFLFVPPADQPVEQPAAEPNPLRVLCDQADALGGVFASPGAQWMLAEVERLPVYAPRTIYAAWNPNRGLNAEQYAELPEDERAGFRELPIEPVDYYSTFYGSPLVYARVLDLLHTHAPGFEMPGSRVLDLGYGQLGQLRLWAQMGASVTGVEVDPVLTALYDGCEAVGAAQGEDGAAGSVRLIEGAWPNDASCREAVGTGYDLFVSRNLLKRGYVKPTERNERFPVPVGWSMSDAEVLGHVFDLLAPGGVVVIESLGPAPDPAKPWSDISNPWSEQAWRDAGFEVLAHDADETEFARTMGRALGWDARMDLDAGLFGVYSVYRRPPAD